MKKYRLTDETITFCGATLYRIEALKDFSDVKKGDKGGFVQSEENLSHDGKCWVYDNATVRRNATVRGSAVVSGNAAVRGDAVVRGNAAVRGDAVVTGNAFVTGSAVVTENAVVRGDAILC